MELKAVRRGDELVVAVDGTIDAACSEEFKKRMEAAVGKAGKKLALDIANVDFIDSAGLGCLVSTSRKCAERRIAFEVVRPQPQIKKLFEITRLYKAIQVKD